MFRVSLCKSLLNNDPGLSTSHFYLSIKPLIFGEWIKNKISNDISCKNRLQKE